MRDTVLCLCDLTGVLAAPRVENGYKAVLVDPQHGLDHEDGPTPLGFSKAVYAANARR